MKQRNPGYAYRRFTMQISIAFDIKIDKALVRRVLNKFFINTPSDEAPSWLTFLGQTKDNLWSIDLFCCESIHLKTHWVMLVMDQYTRRIIDFSVCKGNVSGVELCCIFNAIIHKQVTPKYLSSDNDRFI